jgi:hypothetical protein
MHVTTVAELNVRGISCNVTKSNPSGFWKMETEWPAAPRTRQGDKYVQHTAYTSSSRAGLTWPTYTMACARSNINWTRSCPLTDSNHCTARVKYRLSPRSIHTKYYSLDTVWCGLPRRVDLEDKDMWWLRRSKLQAYNNSKIKSKSLM